MSDTQTLIEQNPHLTPNDGTQDPLKLAAKNLRADLKKEGITAAVRTARFANGNSIDVYVLDGERVEQASRLADRYRGSYFDSRNDYTETRQTPWTEAFGDAKHTSAREAYGEDREKLLGTYKAPEKKALAAHEVWSKFATALDRGTESTAARYVHQFKEHHPDSMDWAWSLATQTYGTKSAYGPMKVMLEAGHDANSNTYAFRNLGEGKALHISAHLGDAQTSEMLIDAGANINAPNSKGNTPLHEAAYKGRSEVVDLLLQRGANPNFTNNADEIPASDSAKAQALLDSARALLRRQSLSEIAAKSRPNDISAQQAAEKAIERADQDGWTELQDGVYLNSRESIQSEQAEWDETDSSKHMDFSTSPYWLTTNAEPIGISGPQDAELLSIVAVDERVVKLTQDRSSLTELPPHPPQELASAEQVQSRRQAYGRAM